MTDVPGERTPRPHGTVPEVTGLITIGCYALAGVIVMVGQLDDPAGWRWVPFVALVLVMVVATWQAGPGRAWVPLAVGLAGCTALGLLADHPVTVFVAFPLLVGGAIAVRGRKAVAGRERRGPERFGP